MTLKHRKDDEKHVRHTLARFTTPKTQMALRKSLLSLSLSFPFFPSFLFPHPYSILRKTISPLLSTLSTFRTVRRGHYLFYSTAGEIVRSNSTPVDGIGVE